VVGGITRGAWGARRITARVIRRTPDAIDAPTEDDKPS
jgi:hypothetical protein